MWKVMCNLYEKFKNNVDKQIKFLSTMTGWFLFIKERTVVRLVDIFILLMLYCEQCFFVQKVRTYLAFCDTKGVQSKAPFKYVTFGEINVTRAVASVCSAFFFCILGGIKWKQLDLKNQICYHRFKEQ